MTLVSAETDPTTDGGTARGAHRLPLLGALLAGALLLSACGGSPEEDARAGSDEPSASALASESADGGSGEEGSSGEGSSEVSSSESGEPVPASSDGPAQNWPIPEAPWNIDEQSEAGAEAALEYWWELIEYARLSGDTQPAKDMASEGCSGCLAQTKSIDEAFEADMWFADVSVDVTRTELVRQEDSKYTGKLVVDTSDYDGYESDGEHHRVQGTPSQIWSAALSYSDGAWAVDMVSFDSSPDGEDS